MADTALSSDNATALREAIDALTMRIDRIEAQAARPSAVAAVQAGLTGAWEALRGGPQDPGSATLPAERGGLLWPVLTVCGVLLALILAVELAEEVFDGLWHIGRWIH